MKKSLQVDMSGKVAIVTGATSGLGKELARGLTALGATVVIGARDRGRGDAVSDAIARETGNRNVAAMTVDVATLASVRAFASALAERYGALALLVNNAGVWCAERRESPDGHELTLATNVLGPHLLSSLLIDRLGAGAPSRIINIVSSFAGEYDASDLDFRRRPYDGLKAYSQSKLLLRMLSWRLAERLTGGGITVNAVSPGFVRTDIYNQPAKGLMASLMAFSARYFAASPAKGADTPLWAAVAPELAGISGRYIVSRKVRAPQPAELGPAAELERLCDQMVAAPRAAAR
jgi:NAD(P)-dependent dehydrogenase (short-subunit alcohol dehydrogenase family)